MEIVRNALDVFNAFIRGELEGQAVDEAVARLSDPHLEWHWHDELMTPDFPQHLRGIPAIIEAWERYSRLWADDLSLEALEFIEAPGDRVLTPLRQRSRKESGVSTEIYVFDVWTIRGGKVRKVELFRHRGEALEAAGLRE